MRAGRRLAILLEENVKRFSKPKRRLEQYRTPPEIAVEMSMLLQRCRCSIVIDLGSGTGMLAYASALTLGCYVVGVELDVEAVRDARLSPLYRGTVVDFVVGDASNPPLRASGSACIVSNPPFGLHRASRGADTVFVEAAARLKPVCMVFLHHAGSSLGYLTRLYTGKGFRTVFRKLAFPIPQMFESHRRRTYYTRVILAYAAREEGRGEGKG